MPELKIKDGKSASVRGCIAYLTRGDRAIASDFINCEEVDPCGRPVWKQMDDLRLDAGNGRPDYVHGDTAPRTFEHIIISPDPRDSVDLATIRALATGWAEKHFGDYQVAIYYHDDNRGNIPHAHLVVNNTNVVNGDRITNKMRAGGLRRMNDDLQEMARKLGLSAFESTAARSAGRKGSPVPATVQDDARTREERAIIDAGGYSWKEDIRQRMACAVKLSRSTSVFLESCEALGMEVRENGKGEWVYSLASHPTWQVVGKRLGFDYSRFGVERRLAGERASRRPKISAEAASRFRSAIAPIVSEGGPTPSVLGMIDGRKYTVGAVAAMLDLCEDLDIRSMDDFHDASAGPMAEEERENLRASWRLAKSLGYLPEHRQRIDGNRLKRRNGSNGSKPSAGRMASTQRDAAPERSRIDVGER